MGRSLGQKIEHAAACNLIGIAESIVGIAMACFGFLAFACFAALGKLEMVKARVR